jgi:hypothetical protein
VRTLLLLHLERGKLTASSRPSAGYSFPLPWYQVPVNLFLTMAFVGFTLLDGRIRSLKTRMKKETGREMLTISDMMMKRPEGVKVVASSLPELDFQPFYIPPDIITCGPILSPTEDVAEADPELAGWLSRAPTILINLGTFFEWNERQSTETAKALRIAFQGVSNDPKLANVQVLWKLKKQSKMPFSLERGSPFYDIIGSEIESQRVRVVSWLATSPLSILESGNIILSVNHAGANSWNEAVL